MPLKREIKFKRKNQMKKYFYISNILLIIAILGFSYYRYTQTDYNYLKQDKSEHIIYTLYVINDEKRWPKRPP